MAPAIQIGTTIEERKEDPEINIKKSELFLKVKFCNSLPDFPFDLKSIKYPFPSVRFVEYKPTNLEFECKYEFLTEPDLGVEIDLVDSEKLSKINPKEKLEQADEQLLEEEISVSKNTKRSQYHAQSVSWLRRTQYISTEATRFQSQTVEKVEAQVGYNIKKFLTEGILYMDRKTQIEAINKTFKDNCKKIERHHSKPNVVPIDILPVFPDFSMWKHPCAEVIFDTNPVPSERPVAAAKTEELCQSMIRGVKDESGEQFVACFLPTKETLEKRRRDKLSGVDYVEDEEYDYKINREYNWNVKNKVQKGYEENYFFVVRNDGVYYNELETRVRLCKRRQNYNQPLNNTRLIIKHRPFTYHELKIQRLRDQQLEAAGYDEDSDQEKEQAQSQTQENENEGETEKNGVSQASSVEFRRQSRSQSKSKSRSRSPSKSSSGSDSRFTSSCSRSSSVSRSDSKSTDSNVV